MRTGGTGITLLVEETRHLSCVLSSQPAALTCSQTSLWREEIYRYTMMHSSHPEDYLRVQKTAKRQRHAAASRFRGQPQSMAAFCTCGLQQGMPQWILTMYELVRCKANVIVLEDTITLRHIRIICITRAFSNKITTKATVPNLSQTSIVSTTQPSSSLRSGLLPFVRLLLLSLVLHAALMEYILKWIDGVESSETSLTIYNTIRCYK